MSSYLQTSQQSQIFCKCDRCFEPLVQLPHLSISHVWLPSPVVYSKLPVYELLALSMAEAVMVRSLDLMDSYYTLSVSSSHKLLILCSPVQGVTIKTVLKLSICILPVWVLLRRHWLANSLNYCEGTGAHKELPTSLAPTQHYRLELLFHN